MLIDLEQRLKATDPSGSFIVQAPAGSGKTEILTQRFLRLLSQVKAPEQIIALTFTRKAANEMRERVLRALQEAKADIVAQTAHQKQTLSYAKQALAHNQAQGWLLDEQPNRLKIMTIDALCQSITHAIPNHALHYAAIHDNTQSAYLEAARECLYYLRDRPEQHQDLSILLEHLDNRQDNLIQFFADLLSQRDLWLPLIYQGKNQSKAQFEQALAWIEAHELKRFCLLIPGSLQDELLNLLQSISTLQPPRSYWQALGQWQRFDELNADLSRHLAAVLLTSSQSLRKSFDHHIGISREHCGPKFAEIKAQSKALFEKLEQLPEIEKRLIHISQLPNPEYEAQQWQVLQALFRCLPILVAHLDLEFQACNRIDFIEIAHQARHALGDAEHPTDLGLYWDHQLQHLLIDEFQDTSIQQFELISQLVQGFEAADGRSLFIVGDPMQSIYRFRGAEVGLFLQAERQGIGPVPLQALRLQANFRSTPALVSWVNLQMQTIFPGQNDIESGAIAFQASVATQAQDPGSALIAELHPDALSEAYRVAALVQQELIQDPKQSIALLVRSRRQLSTIIQVLRELEIPFQGLDIDSLAHLPHIRDLWSLTQILLMPASRLAWLSFLRSPFCGLTLEDLLIVSRHCPSIFDALYNLESIPKLSEPGKVRLLYLYRVFKQAYEHRGQQSLVECLEQILVLLHQDKLLSAEERNDLSQYWQLIKQFETHGQIKDLKGFAKQLQTLFAKPTASAQLQIMTIHKSKGLEFDTVVLPGLGAISSQTDQSLIRWLKLPSNEASSLFLISPIKASVEERNLLYAYLGRIDNEKTFYESQRLLYVALTRAKKRLYLLDHHESARKGSFRSMLKHQEFNLDQACNPARDRESSSFSDLKRLPLHYYQKPPIAPNELTPIAHSFGPLEPKLIGIVTHELLQWICSFHPQTQEDIPWHLFQKRLRGLGLTDPNIFLKIQTQIKRFLADPRGQWISRPKLNEENEYALLVDQGIGTKIIDRTFVEGDIRWIIDFKTGAFNEIKHQRYREQVEFYAKIMSDSSRQLIRCGLYYLDDCQWIEWEPLLCLT